MLKLVLFGALFALAAAAPQFPLYPGYHPYSLYNFSPFPYMRSPLDVPYPFTQPYYPYSFPYVPSYYPSIQQYAHQDQTADQPTAPPAAPVPVRTSAPHKEGVEVPVFTADGAPIRPQPSDDDKGDLSIESAKLYLTPEQQVLFEAAVAAMNPLEYAAKLDSLINPSPSPKVPQLSQHEQTANQKKAPAPVRTAAPPKEGVEVPVFTADGAPIRPQLTTNEKGELSFESARLYLTPEQRVLFEAAVASMNPLEYAAQLDSLKNP